MVVFQQLLKLLAAGLIPVLKIPRLIKVLEEYQVFFLALVSSRLVFTHSKLTIETPEHFKKTVQSKQQRHQNDLIYVLLVWCLYDLYTDFIHCYGTSAVNLEQKNVSWVYC